MKKHVNIQCNFVLSEQFFLFYLVFKCHPIFYYIFLCNWITCVKFKMKHDERWTESFRLRYTNFVIGEWTLKILLASFHIHNEIYFIKRKRKCKNFVFYIYYTILFSFYCALLNKQWKVIPHTLYCFIYLLNEYESKKEKIVEHFNRFQLI